MKKLIILFLVFTGCKNENAYELALKDYIKEDLHFKQARIDYQLEEMRIRSVERYYNAEAYYNSKYKEATLINQLFRNFEIKTLITENVDSINSMSAELKASVLKQASSEYVKKEINRMSFMIENSLKKYVLLRQLKMLNYKVNNLELRGPSGGLICNLGISYSSALATRLNDSLVVLNIYSEIAKGHANNFDNESLVIKALKDGNDTIINVLKSYDDIIGSYLIKTKADTIQLDAILRTTEKMGLLVAKNNSTIVVGKFKEFDTNNLEEYLDFYKNKKEK